MATPRQRRFSVAIVLATLALCALFLAQGTTRVLAAELLAPNAVAPKPPGKRFTASSPSFLRRRKPEAILRRNIFDSARGDLTAEPLPEIPLDEDGQPVADWDPNRPPPKCTGKLRLVGSVVSPVAPDWSFAAIAGSSDGKTMLYREGSEVDGSRVMAVHSSSVVMTGSTGVCQLLMFEEEETTAARAPVAKKPAASKPADARSAGLSAEEMTDGIEKISDTKYNIQRSLVDKVLANQGSLMKSARVIPHEENGRVVGVKLYGIRRNSLLGRLGVRNGDMLRTINGFDMTSPDTALEAYSRLRSADKLTLAIKRQNKETTIDYNIE
ncbi:MAG: general secretion pathway protein GspC [Deltaproteobacteria bacterium]|nr:general secretion pathway protein GspC [Deltaproteobacteria bacterium]NNK08058.1 general secretion pathway protein GspC [Myxococcales bacterium]